MTRKRGIRLKTLDADDPALLELLDTVLCAAPGRASDAAGLAPAGLQATSPPAVARMVREELQTALDLLDEGLAAVRVER